jgi:hypothetical protein
LTPDQVDLIEPRSSELQAIATGPMDFSNWMYRIFGRAYIALFEFGAVPIVALWFVIEAYNFIDECWEKRDFWRFVRYASYTLFGLCAVIYPGPFLRDYVSNRRAGFPSMPRGLPALLYQRSGDFLFIATVVCLSIVALPAVCWAVGKLYKVIDNLMNKGWYERSAMHSAIAQDGKTRRSGRKDGASNEELDKLGL